MSALTTGYKELWIALDELSGPKEVEDYLDAVGRSRAEERITLDEDGRLRLAALRHLKDLTATNWQAGLQFIIRHLIPACEGEPKGDRYRLRELLHEWVEQYADNDRTQLRNRLFSHLRDRPEGEDSEIFITIAAHVGYRDEHIEEVLYRLSGRDSVLGDDALGALAAIGVSDERRAEVVSKTSERLSWRGPNVLGFVLQELADEEFIPLLEERLRQNDSDESLPLHYLARIAGRRPGDAAIQDRIWNIIQCWGDSTEARTLRLAAYGEVFRVCNSSEPSKWLLKELSSERENVRRLAYFRIEECDRPNQLNPHPEDPNLLRRALERDAIRPSNALGNWHTADLGMKVAAWRTALRAGLLPPSEWLEAALRADRQSLLGQHSIMEISACVALEPLPELVKSLVLERYQYHRVANSELFPRIGAAAVCRSAGTHEAFDLLLNSGLTLGELDVLRSTADGVGELAVRLTIKGAQDVAEQLLTACEQLRPVHRRTLAVAGLEAMALRTLLPVTLLPRLISLCEDESLQSYSKARLVHTLGRLSGELPLETVPILLLLANDPDDSDSSDLSEVAFRALEATIRLDFWVDNMHMIADRLWLCQSDGGYVPEDPRRYGPRRGYLLALLLVRSADRFATATAAVIKTCAGETFYQILGVLRGLGPVGDTDPSYTDVCNELADRIERSQGSDLGDTESFLALATLAPTMYATRNWPKVWEGWIPAARAAYADAIGASYERLDGAGVTHLLLLAADEHYAVRRAAFRAMAHLGEVDLSVTCERWIKSDQAALRIRGAEVASWLQLDELDILENKPLHVLSQDREPSVRAAARRELAAARKRTWASHYVDQIRAARDDGNAWVTKAYRYGQALEQTGDDESVRELMRLAAADDIPPNVRHWLLEVAKSTEKNWAKAILKWPNFWQPWRGAYEKVEGKLRLDNNIFQVIASLWRQHRQSPDEHDDWEGAIEVKRHGSSIAEGLPVLQPGISAVLEIAGRRAARVLVTSSSLPGYATISGNDRYPIELEFKL